MYSNNTCTDCNLYNILLSHPALRTFISLFILKHIYKRPRLRTVMYDIILKTRFTYQRLKSSNTTTIGRKPFKN